MKSNYFNRNAKIILIIILIWAQLGLSSCQRKPETATRVTHQMNTTITLQITGNDAERVCDDVVKALHDFEQVASMHLADSDVAHINDSAGMQPVAVDERVYYVIEQAVACSEQTGGLFDVTIGALTDLWSITSDNPVVPDAEAIEAARRLVGYQSIALNAATHEVMLQEKGQKLDLGGIAKGYALDICREIMDQNDVMEAIVSIGGNVMVYKDKAGEPFVVGIRYPEKDNMSYFCALRLTDTIMSTTGGYERFFEQDGTIYHHVIDPRTGYPANSGLVSVSIIHKNGLLADCLSTALYVGGTDYALARMRNGDVEAVVIDDQGNVYISESLREKVVDDLNDTSMYQFIYV